MASWMITRNPPGSASRTGRDTAVQSKQVEAVEALVRGAMCAPCRRGRPLEQWKGRGPVGHVDQDGLGWTACGYAAGAMTGPAVVALIEGLVRR